MKKRTATKKNLCKINSIIVLNLKKKSLGIYFVYTYIHTYYITLFQQDIFLLITVRTAYKC